MGLSILAVDTSTEACSVALLHQGAVISDCVVSVREHAKSILSMVDAVLCRADCRLSQLDAIAFARGPGSFTGIRIGLGVAQGLALGANKPLISISTLVILAQGARRAVGATQVNTAIDARMSQVYFAQYAYSQTGIWNELINERVVSPENVANQLRGVTAGNAFNAGTGFQIYPDMVADNRWSGVVLPDAKDMLPLAESLWHSGQLLRVEDAQPVYLRNEIIKKR